MRRLAVSEWRDYQVLDSGDGRKLERFDPYTLIRPQMQVPWRPALPQSAWDAARAELVVAPDGRPRWLLHQEIPAAWTLSYRELRFEVRLGQSRHLGIFPENAVHWDWIAEQVQVAGRPLHVGNFFGYTGLASLAAAQAGARVTHVDASKTAVDWARHNQALSGLQDRPIRWIVDDALKYLRREARRGVRYDGLVLDPPVFGRGPEGEVWKLERLLPALAEACRAVLSDEPRFVVLTAYTPRTDLAQLQAAVSDMLAGRAGSLAAGELVLREASAGRILPQALFVRWQATIQRASPPEPGDDAWSSRADITAQFQCSRSLRQSRLAAGALPAPPTPAMSGRSGAASLPPSEATLCFVQ